MGVGAGGVRGLGGHGPGAHVGAVARRWRRRGRGARRGGASSSASSITSVVVETGGRPSRDGCSPFDRLRTSGCGCAVVSGRFGRGCAVVCGFKRGLRRCPQRLLRWRSSPQGSPQGEFRLRRRLMRRRVRGGRAMPRRVTGRWGSSVLGVSVVSTMSPFAAGDVMDDARVFFSVLLARFR